MCFIWQCPFKFSLVWVQDYRREKSSGIGVDGLDVLLIPQTPNASPHSINPTWRGRGGGGARGVGGWGGALGGGVLEECYAHMDTYTHVGTSITVGKKWAFQSSKPDLTSFFYFNGKIIEQLPRS